MNDDHDNDNVTLKRQGATNSQKALSGTGPGGEKNCATVASAAKHYVYLAPAVDVELFEGEGGVGTNLWRPGATRELGDTMIVQEHFGGIKTGRTLFCIPRQVKQNGN